MRRRIALMIVRWLMQFVPDYALIWREIWNEVALESIRINEKAERVLALVEPLNAENDALRKQVEDQQAAYDALIEEMEELL